MEKLKKSAHPNNALNFLRAVGQAFSLIVVGSGMWYLFTSGEAIAKVHHHHYRLNVVIPTDTIAHKIASFKDSTSFTELEKFEAQAADSFFNILSSRAKFNGSALIAHDGKILYHKQFGFSDFQTKETLTDTSEFQLGSVSKQFTAVSIMILKERGQLNYDDSIVKYFPDFPYKGVTIRMCLDHRSGLPNYMFTCSAECRDQTTMIDNMQVMDMLAQYKPQCYFQPNRYFDYCNTNYAVLAALVEKISGVKFSEFARKNIFEPLQMSRTFIYDKTDTAIPNKVTGYNAGYRKAGYDFLDGVAGDKGVFSTVTDLLKWDQALYSDKLLSQATLKDAFSPHTAWMSNRSYGYGWRLMLFDGDTVVYHGGWWHGFNCDFIRDVKKKTTIIVLSKPYQLVYPRELGFTGTLPQNIPCPGLM